MRSTTHAIAFDQLDREAAGIDAGSQGALFLPYFGGIRSPDWDPHRRGAFAGLDPVHGRGDLVRSVFEGVAMAIRQASELWSSSTQCDTGTPLIIGGGAQSATWRQIVADVLGQSLTYPGLTDASAGAALLAYRSMTGNDGQPGDFTPAEPIAVVTDEKTRATYDRVYDRFLRFSRAMSATDHDR